jgi:hypothetical protein
MLSAPRQFVRAEHLDVECKKEATTAVEKAWRPAAGHKQVYYGRLRWSRSPHVRSGLQSERMNLQPGHQPQLRSSADKRRYVS